MQLKAVCRVPVGDLSLEIGWQVDDVNGTKWAFLWADTAADAQAFRNVRNLGLGSDFDTEFAGAHHWARLLAFLSTFLESCQLSSPPVVDHTICLTFGLHCGASK